MFSRWIIDDSGSVIDDKIVASLADDSGGVIYECNIIILQARDYFLAHYNQQLKEYKSQFS